MDTCELCKNELRPGESTCWVCGMPVPGAEPEPEPTTALAAKEAEEKPKGQGLWVTGLVVLTLVAIFFIFAATRPDHRSKVALRRADVPPSEVTQTATGASPVVTVSPTPGGSPAFPVLVASTPVPTTKPAAPAPSRAPQPSRPPTPKPSPRPLCGAPNNPWGYNHCGGARVFSVPSGFCSYFNCTLAFPDEDGYVVKCTDGKYSRSGGGPVQCASHGDVETILNPP
jgi:hypothetical protein